MPAFVRSFALVSWNHTELLILTVFTLGGQPSRAMAAYQKANAWQELFTLALTEKRTGSEIKALALEVAGA